MFYVSVNLPCKSLSTEINILTETIFIEVNVQSSKWLFVGCFKLPSQSKELFIRVIYLRLQMHFQQNMTLFC